MPSSSSGRSSSAHAVAATTSPSTSNSLLLTIKKVKRSPSVENDKKKKNNSGEGSKKWGGGKKDNGDHDSNLGTPVDFIIKSMIERDPKKRKVKPAKNFEDLLAMDDGFSNSSDDSDYKPKTAPKDDSDDDNLDEDEDDDFDENDDDDDNGSNDDEESQEDDSQEDEDMDTTCDTKPKVKKEKSEPSFTSIKRKTSSQDAPPPSKLGPEVRNLLICAVCSGDTSSDSDEIVECDSCSITVHENCYGIDCNDVDSVHSNASSASTEPWVGISHVE